jgi:predicted DNA-binding protein (UPF0251 family)
VGRPVATKAIAANLQERIYKPHSVPMHELDSVTLSLEGLEALRLADLRGFYQETAAARMGVARATFARLLAAARKTVAEALVHGKAIEIRGGDVEPRRRRRLPCPMHGGPRRLGRDCSCRPKRGRD